MNEFVSAGIDETKIAREGERSLERQQQLNSTPSYRERAFFHSKGGNSAFATCLR
jgi:hypothetical protein